MEGFNEQVVKRKNGTKQLVIKIIAVLILISVPFKNLVSINRP